MLETVENFVLLGKTSVFSGFFGVCLYQGMNKINLVSQSVPILLKGHFVL